MINQETYNDLEEKYKDVASWAIWSPEGDTPTSNTGDMTVFDNPDLLNLLHSDFVFIALNASVHAERKDGYTGSWRMFHSDDNRRQKDFKLRYAVVGTPYEGSYMTDLIKNHPDKNSNEVQKYCRNNPQTVVDNIEVLKEELKILGGKPVLVAMGKIVYEYLKENCIGENYEIVAIDHYSFAGTSKQELREQLLSHIK